MSRLRHPQSMKVIPHRPPPSGTLLPRERLGSLVGSCPLLGERVASGASRVRGLILTFQRRRRRSRSLRSVSEKERFFVSVRMTGSAVFQRPIRPGIPGSPRTQAGPTSVAPMPRSQAGVPPESLDAANVIENKGLLGFVPSKKFCQRGVSVEVSRSATRR